VKTIQILALSALIGRKRGVEGKGSPLIISWSQREDLKKEKGQETDAGRPGALLPRSVSAFASKKKERGGGLEREEKIRRSGGSLLSLSNAVRKERGKTFKSAINASASKVKENLKYPEKGKPLLTF